MAKYKIKKGWANKLPIVLRDKLKSLYELANKGEVFEADSIKNEYKQYFVLQEETIISETNTKAEIQAYLDSKGISYTSKNTKEELLNLITDLSE